MYDRMYVYILDRLLPPFSLIRDFRKQTPAETFPKFPSIIHVMPYMEVLPVNFQTNTSICGMTCTTDGNFGNVSAGVLFSKVAYQRKQW